MTLTTVEFWGSAILSAVSIGLHLPIWVSVGAILYTTYSLVMINIVRIEKKRLMETFKPLK